LHGVDDEEKEDGGDRDQADPVVGPVRRSEAAHAAAELALAGRDGTPACLSCGRGP
jgi:hypothetical protein